MTQSAQEVLAILCLTTLPVVVMLAAAAGEEPRVSDVTAPRETNMPKASQPATSDKLDIAAFKIERRDMREDVERSEWTQVLGFENSSIKVPLQSAYVNRNEDGSPVYDQKFVDSRTVKIAWLVEDRLLWVSWRGWPIPGSGIYTAEAHVLLILSGGEAREILRQSFFAFGKSSQSCGKFARITFSIAEDSEQESPVLIREVISYSRDLYTRKIGEPSEGNWGEDFGYQTKVIQKTYYQPNKAWNQMSCQTIPTHPAVVRNEVWLEPFDESHPFFFRKNPEREATKFESVAEFCVAFLNLDDGVIRGNDACTAEERDGMMRELEWCNPGTHKWSSLDRRIRLPVDQEVFHPLTPDDGLYSLTSLD